MVAALVFISARLQRLMLAFLCLFLAQVVLAVTTPQALPADSGSQEIILKVEH
jgi:hypothetical protein